jgi:hypothetical protein
MTVSRLTQRNEQRKSSRQSRTRLLLGLAAVLLGSALAIIFWPRPAYVAEVTGRPNLVVDQTQLDFGIHHWGTPVTAVFHVRNTGDQTLQLLNQPQVRVVTGCCPPQLDLGARTIRPGQEISLSMTFVMHEGMDGPHDFRVLLQTNDPAHPEQELTILSNWVQ